ncbi:MAG TPA: type I glyceraldehyde-3-phosphate dehydrogenase [Planctomycetota bacterium]|nr:type I glyceraldehyde-3-phosphate dehydrogenase [Planctomycetota bacterium]
MAAKVKVGINGFGRIGRLVFRVLMERKDQFEVVGINDLFDTNSMAYTLKFDSTHGRYPGTVAADGANLVVDGKAIPVTAIKNPQELPWAKLGVDIAVESTGIFTKKADCELHLKAGAKKVLLSAPAKDPIDATIVLGVNDGELKAEHKVFSNASCTTNCLAPVAKVLNDSFGIEFGLMTTCHAYTNDQRVLDMAHPKELRRSRTAATNIIPTSTGAAKAVGEVIPALKGKLHGFALRVPTVDGSVVDLTVMVKKDVTVEEVNAAMKAAAEGPMKGVLEFSTDELVSSDIIGTKSSSIFDSKLTTVMQKRMVKVISWYDNEWGYSNRMVDLMAKAAKLL